MDNLTVPQRDILLERLAKQTSQEIVQYEIEKRIENDPECPHCQSKHIQRWGGTKVSVSRRCILCTDGSTVYKALALSEGIEHHALVASKGERVKEKVFHIQNINA